ncbi:flagellar hook assembly protein FlgD [Roseateles sp. BYS180W]|uniref:Basal-body rod modification protein FlgD n=1 Tax=Roseateles rivi TaxID=3299028 RepID=A0ABW7FV58_9BURK
MDYSTINATQSSAASASSGAKLQQGAADTQDRFLKLLMAQMKNQDPLNPMDNAQVTTQLAQIQTVTGVGTLNTSIQTLTTQMSQMQALQNVALVGRDVTVASNAVVVKDGQAQLQFDLASKADKVKVEVLTSSGGVLDSIDVGASGAGRQSITWDAQKAAGLSGLQFRVTATSGSTKVDATELARDTVSALNTSGTGLQLQLKNLGSVDYTKIYAVN